jgi:hypothetical protein
VPLAQQMTSLHGSCHCGWLQVEFTTSQNPEDTNPRACDCNFCQKHGAAYISDPAGALRIVAAEPNALHSYRQGSEAARFQLCGKCGVLIAVIFEHNGHVYGAVNVCCLDKRAILGAPVPALPQLLSPQEKISR